MKYSWILLLFLLSIFSCRTQRDITGVYISNFSVNGFFTTKLTFKDDSIMEYKYWGDLTFDTANAHYSIKQNKIYLKYYPIKVDTSRWSELRKMGVTLMEADVNKYGISAPPMLFIKRKRILLFNTEGRVIKRKKDSHFKLRKYFLEKI